MAKVLSQEAELVPVSKLKPHPENPRKGDVKAITESIEKNGFYGHVLAQRSTGHILAGNHTFQAAKRSGLKKVPVLWLDVDDEQAQRILIVDNRLADLGDYDEAALESILRELANSAAGIEGLGYTSDELAELLGIADQNLNEVTSSIGAGEASSNSPEVPQSTVQQVQLFFTAAQHEEFLEKLHRLKGAFKTENITDTVLAAVNLNVKEYEMESGFEEAMKDA